MLKRQTIKRIAVFGPNKPFWGAQIVQVPFYYCLRNNFPGAWIRIYSPKRVGVLSDLNLADDVFLYPRRKRYNPNLVSSLRAYRADLVINLRPQSGFTHLLVVLSRASLKIGLYSTPLTRVLYHRSKKDVAATYKANNYLGLLQALSINTSKAFSVFKELAKRSSLNFNQKRINICIIPGSGDGKPKQWGIENYGRLCQRIRDSILGSHFIFILGPQEQEFPTIISGMLEAEHYTVLMNRSVADIAKAVESSTITVSNDCGPTHIALMSEGPMVSIWKRTSRRPLSIRLKEWFIHRENTEILLPEEGQTIQAIKVDDVWQAVKRHIHMVSKN